MSDLAIGRDTEAAPVNARLTLRRAALLLAAAGACVAIAWYGHDWWVNGRFIETTDDAYVGGNITTISPHVAGFVTNILVADNAPVKAGQLIAQLDPRDFQAVLDRSQATLTARQAALGNVQAQTQRQQSAIHQAAADLSARAAQADFAHLEGIRYATLAVTSAGSRQDAQRTAAAERQASATVAAAQAGLEAARLQLGVLESMRAEAQAAIAQARAELQTARLNLGYTQIRSPIDGTIGNRAAQIGAYVSEGSTLLSIIPANGLWIDANFKEDQLAHMNAGQSASAVADVAPGKTFHGRLESLAPGTGAVFSVIPPENATGNFTKIVQRVPVRIALSSEDGALGRLRPGLSVLVSVDTRTGK